MKTPPPTVILPQAPILPQASSLPQASALVLTAAFFVLMTVFGTAQSPHPAAPPSASAVRWETNIDTAFARAEQEQRPLFLHFVGKDCPPAQQMASEVFVQPNIITQLNANFVMVNINASEQPALAQKFSVTVIPTDLIIRPNGEIAHRRTGGISAERFTSYLSFLLTTLLTPTAPASAASIPSAANPAVAVPQREPVSVPVITQDPFGQPIPLAAVPAAPAGAVPAGPNPPLAENPLRTIETTAPPVPVAHQAPVAAPIQPAAPLVQASANEIVPPPVAVAPTVPAATTVTAVNEPVPSKSTVEVPLALEGFCPVTLCAEERWVSGNPAYCTMFQGQLFRFATPEALVVFAQNPAKFVPVAMGEDVVLMADRNRRVNGDRQFGAWFQERVFLFASQETLNAFAARPEYYREIALKYELARKEQPAPIVY